jgi:hypothetical protein
MRSFLGFGQVPYIGTPNAQPIKLGGIAAQTVPLLFQWISYGAGLARPNINVLVSLETQPCVKLDQIRSVYIDNLASDSPIYIYFPDVGYAITAKPNSEGWYPVYSNSKTFWVVGEGFTAANIPQTWILISNIFMPPSVNVELDNAVALWKASPIITRGNTIFNTNFGTPALGDQFFASPAISVAVGNTAGLWNTPYASGFLYLTSLVINGVQLFSSGGNSTGTFVVESTGIAGTLFSELYCLTPNTPPGVSPLLQLSGLQTKLDATQTWRIRTTSLSGGTVSGQLQSLSSFTVSDL